MKYEFGVGSNKWSLEAKNDNIAYVTMVMHIASPNVPIAVYSQKKAIDSKIILDMDDLEGFMEKNREDLVKARASIVVIGWKNE